MGGFGDVVGKSLTNLTGSILNAPTNIINSAGQTGASVLGNTGGFLSGLFNFGTGAKLADRAATSSVIPAGLQGSLQYGGGESFLSRNKGLLMFVFGMGVVAFVLNAMFGKKKKVGARRRRRPSSTVKTSTTRKTSSGKKSTSFKQVSQATYNGYTRKQKNLYNLAKGRWRRKLNAKKK